MTTGLEHKELTETIIGCAYRVYNTLGSGFMESVYEKAMHVELRKSGLCAELQKPIKVHYDGEIVGDFVADMIVNNTIIVELKAVRQLAQAHEVQLVNYLVATNIPIGLLINFGESKVDVKRKFKDRR